ncbi:MAG: Com family DNA-binding transcriptional regulator [Desulfovibrio sp.]|nr:Com family DNA-binding transcriptional regulator [Desulfovibrio sp.]
MQDIRCPECGKLLARGEALELQLKCPRCKIYFILRAERPNAEPQDGQPRGNYERHNLSRRCLDDPENAAIVNG